MNRWSEQFMENEAGCIVFSYWKGFWRFQEFFSFTIELILVGGLLYIYFLRLARSSAVGV